MVRCHNIARAAAARVSHASNAPARKSAARRRSSTAGAPSPPSGAERVGVRWGIPERSPMPTSPSHASGVGPSLSALKGGEGKFQGPPRVAYLYLAVIVVTWAGNWPLMKLALADAPPLVF